MTTGQLFVRYAYQAVADGRHRKMEMWGYPEPDELTVLGVVGGIVSSCSMVCSHLWYQSASRLGDNHVLDAQQHKRMCCGTQPLRIEVTEPLNQVSYVMQACPQQHGRQEGLKNVMPRLIGHGRCVRTKTKVVYVLASASAADCPNC